MAETWILNKSLNLTGNAKYIAKFTCNGNAYAGISTTTEVVKYLYYASTDGGQRAYTKYGWDNEVYRTIVFDESPSGTLLSWLQRNGVKQSTPDPVIDVNHKTLIDGTGYSIKRGKALIGSTGYDIISGRVLVSGTGYDIVFTPKAYVVTVTLSNYTYVIYNDTLYSNDTVLYVTPGDSVRCVVNAPLRDGRTEVAVRVNGTEVETSSFQGPPPYSLGQYSYYYDFTPESDATVVGIVGGANRQQHGEIDVTT